MEIVREKLNRSSIVQYKIEERSIIAKRLISFNKRINRLISIMKMQKLSLPENLEKLKIEIFNYTKDSNFKKSK